MTERRGRGRGPGPFIVLLAVVALPAIALFATHRWAQAQIVNSEPAPEPSVGATALPANALPTTVLSTPLATLRRIPTIVSRTLSIDSFAVALEPFLASIDDRSCVSVSVDGEPVASRNADLAVIPASTQKLLVAAVALERLGPDFRYTTKAVVSAPAEAGVVTGDLYLVGGGDPLLTSDWYPTSNLERYPVMSPTRLESLADGIVASGVTSITGNIVGDATRYDDEFFAPGWADGVAGLEAGPYDALMANDSRVLDDQLKDDDPAIGAVRELTRMLSERGVEIGGSTATAAAPQSGIDIASVQSVPLSEVVAEMLGNSDNNTAELLVKEIGFVSGEGTRVAGLAEIERTLTEWTVDTEPMNLADGSGLSPENLVTCAALLTVLQRDAADGPIGTGLPIAGQTGTLADIFVDHPIAGRLLGKTGTLSNPPFNADPPAAKALAGYVVVEGGSEVEYALVLNGPTISDQTEYRPIWNALADALDTYPSGPTPAQLGPR